ncbi:glycerol-3-phosphate dehydrogenase [Methyloversatilis sp. XJ19-49]|uniref:glycerol-3-phosphate dehydrogenase n=1 Tax=Methyloversatilis sp. XJ19-49 TaxID=2963429 RepID=UPI0027B9ED56|nr:glycerol-3-phosphate dehydrogenase [Methyloversatilis sp. XJ19-49]
MPTMVSPSHDLLIVGAGINGAGIARDAALRGLSVVVCDRGDIAGATSSASTKLIHGGIRYLEQAAFGLVRESLRERQILGRIAAHLVRPQRFIVPHTGERPAWMLAIGLGLYDLLAGRHSLPPSHRLPPDFQLLRELDPPVSGAHAYFDLWVDDARLTLTNLMDAHAHGAEVLPRHELVAVSADPTSGWRCELSGRTGRREIHARCVVNVAGPWVAEVEGLRGAPPPPVRLVQGTHILLPRLHAGDDAWLLQQPDRRVVFVIPWDAHSHLVGTTETELASPSALGATAAELHYLLSAVQRAFGRRLHTDDIEWAFSGMRPLIGGDGKDARTASREYRLSLDATDRQRTWLTVQGGKLTTYRRLAETAVDLLNGPLGLVSRSSTAERNLPGSGPAGSAALADLSRKAGVIPKEWIDALWHRHGALTGQLIDNHAGGAGGAGRDFGGGLFEAEARWCAAQEWATAADDVMWRRTRCGVRMTPAQRAAFTGWWSAQPFG